MRKVKQHAKCTEVIKVKDNRETTGRSSSQAGLSDEMMGDSTEKVVLSPIITCQVSRPYPIGHQFLQEEFPCVPFFHGHIYSDA